MRSERPGVRSSELTAAEARYANLRGADPSSLNEVRNSGPVRDLERRYLDQTSERQGF